MQFLALTGQAAGLGALHAVIGGITPISFSGGRRVVKGDSDRILRPAMGCRGQPQYRSAQPGAAARAWIWWCQAVRPAKARVTAAVRLETCSRR